MTSVIDNKSVLSRTILSMRFPMCVLVVFIHASTITHEMPSTCQNIFSNTNFLSFRYINEIISNIIARVAVPSFFLISAFLLFYSISSFSWSEYFVKIKKRFYSLFIPYLAWNMVIAIAYFTIQWLTNGSLFNNHKFISELNYKDILSLFWSSIDFWNYPIDWPLWFIRNLMVAVIFSPLFYFCVKYLKFYPVLILAVLWGTDIDTGIGCMDMTTILFFYIGTYLGYHKANFIHFLKPRLSIFLVIYLLCIVAVFIFHTEFIIVKMSILIGIMLFFAIFSNLLDVKHFEGLLSSKLLSSSSFFIFAFHAFPIVATIKVLVRVVAPNSSVVYSAIYFFSVFFVIAVGLGLFCLVRKSNLLRIIFTGNR